MWPGFRLSTLFSAMITGIAEREDAPRDEAVAGADPLARREHEEDDVDVLERRVHGRCIRSVSLSIGRWKPGRSTSTSW